MKAVAFSVLWVFLLAGAALCAAQAGAVTEPSLAPVQPIPFSHKKHAGELQLPCEFCHVKPDPGVQMTLPDTAKCMACHFKIAEDKPSIQKLAAFHNSKKAIPWVQVYSVPGFVFWSHDVHLSAKVECSACHGDVTKLDTISKVTNVTAMAGCVACHKQRSAPTGCMVCHETQNSRMMLEPLPAIFRKIMHSTDAM